MKRTKVKTLDELKKVELKKVQLSQKLTAPYHAAQIFVEYLKPLCNNNECMRKQREEQLLLEVYVSYKV